MNKNLMHITSVVMKLLQLTLLLTFTPHASAGIYPYAESKNVIASRTVEILKRHGMAVAIDREDPWVAFSGVPGDYTIWLHRSDEIPQQAVLDIVKLCLDFYNQHSHTQSIHLVLYRQSKDEWRKSLFLGIGYFAGVKPFFELNLTREK